MDAIHVGIVSVMKNRNLLISIFVCVFAAYVSACSTSPETVRKVSGNGAAKTGERGIYDSDKDSLYHIHIVNHGWHTGIIIPSESLNLMIPDLLKRFPKAVYYEIGWGDSGFYQADEITSKLTLKALFASEGAVVHIVGFSNSPEEFFSESEMIMLGLNVINYHGLLEFIKSGFMMDKSGNPIRLKSGIYGDSQFYQGAGRYHAFNTCNTWTAKALASAGFDINTGFKLTSGSIMEYLDTIKNDESAKR
jgi:uncharacterized protein (TIGR02117 family)